MDARQLANSGGILGGENKEGWGTDVAVGGGVEEESEEEKLWMREELGSKILLEVTDIAVG